MTDMPRLYLLVALFLAKLAFAAPQAGVSEWHVQSSCVKRDGACSNSSATLSLFVGENEACGSILEAANDVSTEVWFRGNLTRGSGKVEFIDAFQNSEREFGYAFITLSGKSLKWQIAVPAAGGRVTSELQFQRVPASTTKAHPASSRCVDLEREWSTLSIQLPTPTEYEWVTHATTVHFVCGDISYNAFSGVADLPSYYLRESTREVISACGGFGPAGMHGQQDKDESSCPPAQWVADDCEARFKDGEKIIAPGPR